jgi:hypothetical protein
MLPGNGNEPAPWNEPRVAGDGNDRVLTGRQLAKLEPRHGTRSAQRLLRVKDDVGERVKAEWRQRQRDTIAENKI